MQDIQYKKLKKAILKLKEENESLKKEFSDFIEKGEKINEKKKDKLDELDEWFGYGEEDESD